MASRGIELQGGDVVRTLEEKTEAGIWLWDYATRCVSWSDGLYRLFGLTNGSSEPNYAHIYQATHPDDRIPFGEFARLIEESGSFHREFRVIWPDGRIRWLSTNSEVIFDTGGKPLRIIGIDRDITTRKELDRRKDLAERRFRALIQISDSIIFTALPNSDLVDVDNVEQGVARDPQQYTLQRWKQFIHPDDLPSFEAAIVAATTTAKSFEVEHRVRMMDNSYRWRLTRATPVRDADNVIREYVGYSKDIDAKKRAHFSLNGTAMTGAQLRAARGIANLSVRELSEQTGVTVATIRRIEESDEQVSALEIETKTLRTSLEQKGVDFFTPTSGKPGVRPR